MGGGRRRRATGQTIGPRDNPHGNRIAANGPDGQIACRQLNEFTDRGADPGIGGARGIGRTHADQATRDGLGADPLRIAAARRDHGIAADDQRRPGFNAGIDLTGIRRRRGCGLHPQQKPATRRVGRHIFDGAAIDSASLGRNCQATQVISAGTSANRGGNRATGCNSRHAGTHACGGTHGHAPDGCTLRNPAQRRDAQAAGRHFNARHMAGNRAPGGDRSCATACGQRKQPNGDAGHINFCR